MIFSGVDKISQSGQVIIMNFMNFYEFELR